jgi:hypothetical protein
MVPINLERPSHMSSSLVSSDVTGLWGSLRRELIVLVAALAVGAFVVPALLWLWGPHVLGRYPGGGILDMLANFLRGLARGSIGFWTVVIGPYVLLTVVRVLYAIVRSFFTPAD